MCVRERRAGSNAAEEQTEANDQTAEQKSDDRHGRASRSSMDGKRKGAPGCSRGESGEKGRLLDAERDPGNIAAARGMGVFARDFVLWQRRNHHGEFGNDLSGRRDGAN